MHITELTLEQGTNLPDTNWSLATELAGSHLKQKDWDAHEDQRDHIWDQKCTYKFLNIKSRHANGNL